MSEHHTPRRRLSDILDGKGDELRKQWDSTEAAGEYKPLPAGTYEAHLHAVDLFTAKKGTPGVKIVFRVADGEHTGRLLFSDSWLTAAALPMTKRDLLKLGFSTLEQLETADVPPGRVRCAVRVALRHDDDGTERNTVKGFNVLRIEEPERDPFAPADAPAGTDTPDTDFNFGANAAAPAEGMATEGRAE